jgi:methyl-accepting chemotaxis protein
LIKERSMKKNELSVKIVLTVVVVISVVLFFIISLDYLSLAFIVHYGSLKAYAAYVLNFMLTTMIPLLAVFSAIFVAYLRPLQKAVNELKAGRTLESGLREKAMSRMFGLPVLTLILNFSGFLGGFVLFAINFNYFRDFFTFKIISYLIFVLAGSAIYSFVQISVHDQILSDVRKMLNINFFTDGMKTSRLGIRSKTVLLSLALIIYSLSFLIHKQLTVSESQETYVRFIAAEARGELTAEAAKNGYVAYLASKFGHYLKDPDLLGRLYDAGMQAAIASNHRIFIGIVFAFMVCLGFFATLAYSRELVLQIGFQTGTIESILDGRESLDKRINIIQFDEVGKLTSAINLLMDKLSGIVSDIGASSASVGKTSAKVDSGLKDATVAIQGFVASSHQISRNSADQMKTVGRVKAITEGTLEQIASIAKNVNEQASFVEETAAAMNEMAASTKSISDTTQTADRLSSGLLDAAKKGEASVGTVTEAIGMIKEASARVLGIVDVISNIASHTNLLSMNASIEAAHAGDSGRGFAVVAGEIRRLAEDSKAQADEIVSCLDDMERKIEHGVVMASEAKEAFGSVSRNASETAGLINEIARATVEQRQSATEIISSVGSVVQATEDVRGLTESLRGKSEEIRSAMESLLSVSTEISSATEAQNKGNRQLESLISDVRGASDENLDIVKRLRSTVDRFKNEDAGAEVLTATA